VTTILKLKQYFCRHDFKYIARHQSTSQNLWECKKCQVYVIQHWGLDTHYKCKEPNIDGWLFEQR
jgi:hypothetical protein